MADEEILDIVDENDAVLFQASRAEAHKKGLLHRCVLAQLINSRGEWVLVTQASDRQDAGQLVVPVGGHVRAGEESGDALMRETLEEIGFDIFEKKFIGKTIFRRTVLGRDENHLFHFYEIYSDIQPRITEETAGFEVFAKGQLKKEIQQNPGKFGDAFYFTAKTFYPDLLLP